MQRRKRLLNGLSKTLLGAGMGVMLGNLATSAVAQSGEVKIGEINSYSLLPAFTEPCEQACSGEKSR